MSVGTLYRGASVGVQAFQTGKGPVQNWQEHVADPWNVNGFNYATKFFGSTIGQ